MALVGNVRLPLTAGGLGAAVTKHELGARPPKKKELAIQTVERGNSRRFPLSKLVVNPPVGPPLIMDDLADIVALGGGGAKAVSRGLKGAGDGPRAGEGGIGGGAGGAEVGRTAAAAGDKALGNGGARLRGYGRVNGNRQSAS